MLHMLLEAAKREYSATRIVVKMQGLSGEKCTNVLVMFILHGTCSYSMYTLAYSTWSLKLTQGMCVTVTLVCTGHAVSLLS